jgi:ketol-acid reductoisomerase
MAKNDQIHEFITAVGSLAETSAMFFKQILKQGIPPKYAYRMTCALINAIIDGKENRHE